jgi:hypothetical protein
VIVLSDKGLDAVALVAGTPLAARFANWPRISTRTAESYRGSWSAPNSFRRSSSARAAIQIDRR